MRYFSVRPCIIIDSQLPLMILDGNEVTLEPKQHQLLLFFCRHPNTIISRDQIIQEVNQGVVVSDNAVNKMVANLRQVLDDNPKQPQFIKTIPKQGYCFIAAVDTQDSITKPQQEMSEPVAQKPARWPIIALICVAMVLMIVLFNNQNTVSPPQNNKLVPLTRHSGVEFTPAISPDGRYLAYSRNEPSKKIAQLWLKDLQNPGDEKLIADVPNSTEVAWSSDSRQLIYTNYLEDVCRLHSVRFSQGKPQASTRLTECHARYIPEMLLDENNQVLYYVAQTKGMTPKQIFRLNLQDNSRQLINQPELAGSGNYSMDLSADGQKLLILSTDDQFMTTLYVLDRQTNELTDKGSWDRRLTKAIWHHDNQTIVHTTNAYSHELVQSDVWGEQLTTIASTSNRVADNFRRHPNGRDFYFTSFMMNNDILKVDVSNNQTSSDFNSAVYEKLPTFGATVEQWFFASKRHGITQLFSASTQDNQLKQLTNEEYEADWSSLDASPDGQKLLVIGDTQVTLMKADGEEIKTVTIPSGLVLSAHWLSNTVIAVSALNDNPPQLYTYDLDTQSITKADTKWQAAFASPSGNRWFYIEKQTLAVYEWDKENQRFIDTGVKPPSIYGNGLTVKASETAVIYAKAQADTSQLISFDLQSRQSEVLGEWLYMRGFDVLDESIVLSYEHSRTGDVVMTQF